MTPEKDQPRILTSSNNDAEEDMHPRTWMKNTCYHCNAPLVLRKMPLHMNQERQGQAYCCSQYGKACRKTFVVSKTTRTTWFGKTTSLAKKGRSYGKLIAFARIHGCGSTVALLETIDIVSNTLEDLVEAANDCGGVEHAMQWLNGPGNTLVRVA